MTEIYEILALKYACHRDRIRLENFIQADDHASPQPLDYFIWVVRNANRTIVVDTGFDRKEAMNRGRALDYEPVDLLSRIGIDARAIRTVIITHLHHDHAGTLDQFPSAQFHVQESEVAYATGPCMCDEVLRRPYTADHVCTLVQKVFAGRVVFHDGDAEIAPGVTVHKVPGHTMGMQCVRVATETGAVVLASDATHYYENFERRRPFSVTVDLAQTLKSYNRLLQLATSPAHVVPGHDPLVLERYPALKTETKGVIHRLDVGRLK